MSADEPAPTGEGQVWGFADGLLEAFDLFRRGRPADSAIAVTVTLWNNQVLRFDGLRIDRLPTSPDSVMIQGASSGSKVALVVREEHLLAVDFEADPVPEADPDRPFGF